MNGLDNITFPGAGIDLIQHEVRINLFQVKGRDEKLLETLTFQGRMLIERGNPFKTKNGVRRIDFIVKSWVASAWSRTLKQEILYVLSEDAEQPLSSIVAETKKNDFPARIQFNVIFDVRANNRTIKTKHEGRPDGHGFMSIPPALDGRFDASPTMSTFGDDDIIDLGVFLDQKGKLSFVEKPTAAALKKGGVIVLRIKPVDCNDKAGRTLVSFADLALPPGLPPWAGPLFSEIPFLQSDRLGTKK